MKKNDEISFDKTFLLGFQERINSSYNLARQSLHNTHQWAITLSFAILTAFVALSDSPTVISEKISYSAVLISFPLMIRFFIRSCLEYSIQEKMNEIRRALDLYFLKFEKESQKEWHKYIAETIQIYYFDWACPKKMWEVVWTNLKLAYLWIFFIYISFIILGAIYLFEYSEIVCLLGITLFFTIIELCIFLKPLRYRGFTYKQHLSPPIDKSTLTIN